MIVFRFTQNGEKQFLKLPENKKTRILGKLNELKTHKNIFSILKRMIGWEPSTHRLCIGSYRLLLELQKQEKDHSAFGVLKIGDRRDIYK